MHPDNSHIDADPLDELMGTIYYLGDSLGDLAGALLARLGPIDDRIDYAQLQDEYIGAANTVRRTMALLDRLLLLSLGPL